MESSRSTQAAGGARTLGAVALAAALAVVVGMAGCSANYVENSQASVLLVIQAINGGAPILSDVRSGDTNETIVNCDAEIDVTVLAKNASENAVPGPSEDVVISRYEVSYTRSDGRGAEGVDVPHRIVGPLTLALGPGDTGTFPVTIVRHQAKLDPPLVNIDGSTLITMAAKISLYGETISGEGVSASGSVQVTFADYAEGAETCEGQ